MTQARQVTVTGDVQGVGFRAFTRDAARDLGVTGWVRNRDDGAVEAHLQGTAGAVKTMLERLGTGPRASRVDAVDVRDADLDAADGFEIVS